MASSKFATIKQLLALALVAAALLCLGDTIWNPRSCTTGPLLKAVARADKPRVMLLMKHMCCSGCVLDLHEALDSLGWVGAVNVVKRGPEETHEGADRYENRVALEILDVEKVDFVKLDRAIRDVGLVAEEMVFDGLPHFRLEAGMKHMCCKMCEDALNEGLQRARTQRSLGFHRWVDSVRVSKEGGNVTLFAGYNHAVDVAELVSVFGRLGFAPHTLRVLPGDEPRRSAEELGRAP